MNLSKNCSRRLMVCAILHILEQNMHAQDGRLRLVCYSHQRLKACHYARPCSSDFPMVVLLGIGVSSNVNALNVMGYKKYSTRHKLCYIYVYEHVRETTDGNIRKNDGSYVDLRLEQTYAYVCIPRGSVAITLLLCAIRA